MERSIKEITIELLGLVMSLIRSNKLKVVVIVVMSLSVIITIAALANYSELYIENRELEARRIPSKTKNMEYAYMEGQIDYMRGDIRIKRIDNDYEFILSPWDGSSEPTYMLNSEYKKDIEWWKN